MPPTAKPNINDAAKLRDVKRALTSRGVSKTAIGTLEKAIRKGMVFGASDDLKILDIPDEDARVAADVVTFGPASAAGSSVKRVQYRFVPDGDETKFFGYQFIVRFVDNDDFTLEESYPIEVDRTVVVDHDLSVIKRGTVVGLRVDTASGSRTTIRLHNGAAKPDELIEVPVASLGNAIIDVTVEALKLLENPAAHAAYAVKGKVISLPDPRKLDGLQVVIRAATTITNNVPDYVPVASAITETNGYFVTPPLLFEDPADSDRVRAAKASIDGEDIHAEVPIRLTPGAATRSSRIPEHVILVIDGPARGAEDSNDCGCGDLNFHEKKTLEEHSYYTVVRTSEPSIIADVLEDQREIDLQDIYGIPIRVPFAVFKKFHAIQRRQITPRAGSPQMDAGAAPAEVGAERTVARTMRIGGIDGRAAPFNEALLDRLLTDHRADEVIKGDKKPVFRGRTYLTQSHQIDWDDEPTIYQAASIAHGHLLHFKQEWLPDGYSIGDLVYSLPLAPGQKKQIAVLDWERRESAARSQSLEYEETLNGSLVRDRDVSDVVSGTLTENIRGNSRASTGGIGFGLGSSVMGIIPGVGSFGGLLGISGGGGIAKSSAGQSATREMTANSLQTIVDRTQQAASVVRSQRATVVQSVSQGERVQATAESVANYNHCHAITIQYFEVLRHFAVRTRLAGVQECLFVPLQMTPFDLEKVMRWRNSLEKHLFRRDLARAFDAVARVQNEKESAQENYYDSIGFPRRYFAEQAIESYTGELLLEFFFFNTAAEKIDEDVIRFFNAFGVSLDAFRDKQITDEQLAQAVGPRTAEFLLDAFTVRTDDGTDLRLDATLNSSFRQNAPLRVSLRQSAGTPRSVARDRIDAITINLDLGRLSSEVASSLTQFGNKYMKIRLRSGALRYRTANQSRTLFDGRIDNDIFAGGDGAYISTPLSSQELRNPRGEDVELVNSLLHHLNENLEYYNKALFFDFTPERRFMLLDGIIAPGKANGRSVASVVENRVIGVAGNSLIMPVAPGNQLDPMIDEKFDLFAQYYNDRPDELRISIPTRGVYAEAVMGACNSCEEKDETRFWRWEESPIPDSPSTQILPISTDTRRADPGDLEAKDFPAPIVNIQNAPDLPEPASVQGLLDALGKAGAFRDVTGLNQTQLSALAAFQKAMDTAKEFGSEAAELAKSMATIQAAKDAQRSGALPNADVQAIVKKELDPSEKAKVRAAEREQEHDDSKKDVQEIEDAKNKEQLDDGQAKDMTEDRIRKSHGTTKPPRPRRKPTGKRKINLTIYMRDIEGRPLIGSFLVFVGPVSASPLGKMDITGMQPFGQFSNVEIDSNLENPINIVGDPVLSPGNDLLAIGPEFYHHAFDSLRLGTGPNVVVFVQQTRKTITLQFDKEKSEQEVKEHTFKAEGGYETGTLAKLLAGSISVNFGYEHKRATSTETTTGESHTYTVHYPARRLKLVTKGFASNEIDPDE